MPESRRRNFWLQADRDGDGETSFEEFVTWKLRYFSSGVFDPCLEVYQSARPPLGVPRNIGANGLGMNWEALPSSLPITLISGNANG